MNSSHSKDSKGSVSVGSAPIVLDVEVLKQVSGGVVKVPDPGWLQSPIGQPQGTKVNDPTW
jgi:hypothetical protein